jgi:pyruvate-formate lyase-activating enzyme
METAYPSLPKEINPLELFRLPWTMADNGITWLEPTRYCNISCDACFHFNDPGSEKSLDQIEEEVRTLLRLRRTDCILIAGGEPLSHPRIAEITRMVRSYKTKPVILTNGVALDERLVKELKEAGAYGFSFHVDAHQNRPGWTGKSEKELNNLRQQLADMVHREGGLLCAFILTVFPDTIGEMPDVMEWAVRQIKKVNLITFSLLRAISRNDPWDYYAGTQKIDVSETPFVSEIRYRNMMTEEIYRRILEVVPEFRFNSYLGGTVLPNSLKWTLGNIIASARKVYGCSGPKSMELAQNAHHFFTGKYLAYTKPRLYRTGRSMLLFSLFDREIRQAAKRYLISVLRNPLRMFEKLYLQSISVVQPVDILPNGESDSCDGCPNKTYWEGRLVSACRVEEYLKFGRPLHIIGTEKVEDEIEH